MVPEQDERRVVDDVIYDELVLGEVRDESRQAYRKIIERLAGAGAEGVILGCTEIELLISQADSPVPVFASTRLHAQAAVDFALRS
ncbi:MAG: aspartate/glutamate racemase family protein [Microlunatus sp.]|nr:aspartate/glutamate racemase family protein [Microlunatus sp.]